MVLIGSSEIVFHSKQRKDIKSMYFSTISDTVETKTQYSLPFFVVAMNLFLTLAIFFVLLPALNALPAERDDYGSYKRCARFVSRLPKP